MAITFVGGATAASSVGAALTLTLPSMQEGDCVIVIIASPTKPTFTVTSSSGAAYQSLVATSSASAIPGSFFRKMSSTPDTQALCSSAVSSLLPNTAVAMVFRSVDQSTSIDTSATSTQAGSSQPNSPAVTTVTPNCAIITGIGITNSAASITAPSGYSDQTSITVSAVVGGGVNGAWTIAPSAGSFDPNPWTAPASLTWGSVTIALRSTDITVIEWQQTSWINGVEAYMRNEIVGY